MISRVIRVKQAGDALRYDMQLAICIYVNQVPPSVIAKCTGGTYSTEYIP